MVEEPRVHDSVPRDGVDIPEVERRQRWATRSRAVDWAVYLLLTLASIGLVLVHVPQHTTVSPIDEYVYIDYLAKVPTNGIVREGEETGSYARQYLSCHGVRTIGYYPEEMCSNPQASQEARLPNGGYTSADLYTPLYFGATWVMAQPLEFLGVDDLTTAGRYTGWTWLAGAGIFLYVALRRLKVPAPVGAGVALLMVGSLPAYWSNTYISTDASALFAGALMFFAATGLINPTRRRIILFIIFAVVVALLKLQNLMAVGAAALFVLIYTASVAARSLGRWQGRLGRFLRDRRTLTAIAALVAAVLAQGIWVVTRSILAVGEFPDQGVSAPFGKMAFLREMLSFFPGVSIGALDPKSFGIWAVLAYSLLAWVIVAGVLGLLASSRRGSVSEALGIASFVVALVAAPALAIANIAVSGYYFVLPARYGMSLIPFFLACAALLFGRKAWIGYLIPVLGVISYAAVLAIPEVQ